jgi:tetratricopeptide (TPR) repeat protein/TolB-like protein
MVRQVRIGGSSRRRLLLLGVLALVGAVGLFAEASDAGQTGSSPPAKVRLAVLPFSGSADGLPEGFGFVARQAIGYALQQVRGVSLLDSGRIVESAERLGLPPTEGLSDEDLLRLGRELKVRGLIAGSYVADGEAVKIRARLVDLAGQGQVILGEESAAPAKEYLAGPRRIVKDVLQRFQVLQSELDGRRLAAALGDEPSSLEAYALYGRAVWDQGLGNKEAHERAIALLTKALDVEQNFALARVALGVSLYATGNRWKASGEFRKAIQINPRLAEAHRLLGDMLVSSPRRPYDQAILAYAAALEIWPDYVEARVGIGDARQAKGEFDEAIEEYKKAIALEPENARVHYGMGKIYYNEKQLYHEAVVEYQQAIALDPRLIDAYLSLGEMYEEKGLYKEAVASYDRVLAMEPKHPGAMYGLALSYEKLDVNKAKQQWERYLELAASLPSEKDWTGIARKHLEKLQRGEKPN